MTFRGTPSSSLSQPLNQVWATDNPLAQIAFDAGYADPSHFTRDESNRKNLRTHTVYPLAAQLGADKTTWRWLIPIFIVYKTYCMIAYGKIRG